MSTRIVCRAISTTSVTAFNNTGNTKHRVQPLTNNQKWYAEYLRDPSIPVVIAIGKAGSGKTLLAASQAIDALYTRKASKIIITRPAVYLDEEHGYLPGDINDKMLPWLKPVEDAFMQYYSTPTLHQMIKNGSIEVCPLAYIRGRTFHNAFIIADEMQNASIKQMKTLLTRLGENTKIAITGDLEQCDLPDMNGLKHFLDHLMMRNRRLIGTGESQGEKSIRVVEFTETDIQRSETVKTVLSIYKETMFA